VDGRAGGLVVPREMKRELKKRSTSYDPIKIAVFEKLDYTAAIQQPTMYN